MRFGHTHSPGPLDSTLPTRLHGLPPIVPLLLLVFIFQTQPCCFTCSALSVAPRLHLQQGLIVTDRQTDALEAMPRKICHCENVASSAAQCLWKIRSRKKKNRAYASRMTQPTSTIKQKRKVVNFHCEAHCFEAASLGLVDEHPANIFRLFAMRAKKAKWSSAGLHNQRPRAQ